MKKFRNGRIITYTLAAALMAINLTSCTSEEVTSEIEQTAHSVAAEIATAISESKTAEPAAQQPAQIIITPNAPQAQNAAVSPVNNTLAAKASQNAVNTAVSNVSVSQNTELPKENNNTSFSVSPVTAITVSNAKFPQGTLNQGQTFTIGGIISAPSIAEVFGGVYRAEDSTAVLYCEDKPNSTSYDLGKKFDNALAFDKLQPGNYVYKIYLCTSKPDDTTKTVIESNFTVVGAAANTKTQQTATVKNAAQNTTASSSAEETAAKNAIAYAGGNGYKIISTEAVKTADNKPVYRFGIVPIDNPKAPAWYYYAGDNFAMTELEWLSANDCSREDWDRYYGSAEHEFNTARLKAIGNAITFSNISNAQAVSYDFINYDYDKYQYAFKIGLRSENSPNAAIKYFVAGEDYAMNYEDWTK
jgi:hypothetical protein